MVDRMWTRTEDARRCAVERTGGETVHRHEAVVRVQAGHGIQLAESALSLRTALMCSQQLYYITATIRIVFVRNVRYSSQ